MSALLRGTRRDFADWRRREPVWSVVCCGFAALFAVQGVLRLATGGDDPTFWLGIAFMYGAYIGAKLEVSQALRRPDNVWRLDPRTGIAWWTGPGEPKIAPSQVVRRPGAGGSR